MTPAICPWPKTRTQASEVRFPKQEGGQQEEEEEKEERSFVGLFVFGKQHEQRWWW